MLNDNSAGGAFFARTNDYIEAGGENENLIGWGFDDFCRFNRFLKLGYNIDRIEGVLYHMTHWRGNNSSPSNPNNEHNFEEYTKVTNMSKEELQEYVNHPYPEGIGVFRSNLDKNMEIIKQL